MADAIFRWQVSPTTAFAGPLQRRAARAGAIVYGVAQNGAQHLATRAKEVRPWTDRTNAARAGLTGVATREGENVRIQVFHTAEHGPYLELGTSRMRPYPAIMPAFQELTPTIVDNVGKALSALLEAGG